MCDKISLVLITGMPGVGKTTITKKLYDSLTANSIQCFGFYTEEIRNTENGERIGFDVINLQQNERKILARSETNNVIRRLPKIGKYFVYTEEFEEIALKILPKYLKESVNNKHCLILDEIGKMELLSKNFENQINNLIEKIEVNNFKVIATIPNRHQLKIIEKLLSLQNAKLFTIKKSNRNEIFKDIEKLCFKMFK